MRLIFKENKAILREFKKKYSKMYKDEEKVFYIVDNMLKQAYYFGLMSLQGEDLAKIKQINENLKAENNNLTDYLKNSEKKLYKLQTKINNIKNNLR